MHIVYLARVGVGAVRWVASDRTSHVVGDLADQRMTVWRKWCDRHGWPDAMVVVAGVYPTLARALEAVCGEHLLSISVVCDLGERRPGRLAWGCSYWITDTGWRDGPPASLDAVTNEEK